MSETTSNCVVAEQPQEKTLTLTHNFTNNTTTLIFKGESSVLSASVKNDTSIIKEAMEEMAAGL